jgi:general secretion pathway protein A
MDNLYLTHFGLREAAFNITPDPAFLYLSTSHREGLAQLSYGVKARKGFIVLTGEVGTGKTTLIQALLKELDASTQTALIFSTITTALDLLRFVCEEFGLTDFRAPRQDMHDYLTLVNEFLLERYRACGNCVLIIDEAQNLSAEVLESIRLLSNFETPKDKLLQILLVGQPELATRLNSSTLRQLKQRITLRHHLRPLSLDECREYIVSRLRSAGREDGQVFRSAALQAIHAYAGGLPRLINILCDNAMLTAFAFGKSQVEFEMVREVAEDLNLTATMLNTRSFKIAATTHSNGLAPKPIHPPAAASLQQSEPAPDPRSVANPITSSATPKIVTSGKFLDELSALLIEAMGPMASVVLHDRVISLGESLDQFPESKLCTLIDAVSHEILDASMKQEFQRLAKERLDGINRLGQH